GRCYSLKTVILPKNMKRVRERAFQESEYLETLVIGDECEEFVWSALDDCASITRMYILSKKKLAMENESWVCRNLCNNYSPTFDAFYVRPSLYQEYINDDAYTGSQQRTNNISKGAFNDDESFAAFAAHAAATKDELMQIGDVSGWFRNHIGVIDLNALQYTSIDSLRTADVAPLTQLRSVTLPASVTGVGQDAFKNAIGLRYVDLSQCADYAPTLAAEGGVRSLGIGENTLAYVPAKYGESADVNVAVGDSTSGVFHAQTFRLVDGLDYCVPYAVEADNVENTRTLAKSPVPYTVCLPYAIDIPAGAKVYRLSGRGTNELIFAQHTGRMEAMQPYLVWTENNDALLSTVSTTLPASTDGNTVGRQQSSVGYTLRGSLKAIPNLEAVELGAYVMNDDAKWHPVLSDSEAHRAVTIPAFRCFLLQSRQGARTIGMTLEDADGIVRLRTVDNDGTECVYDLSGRRIDESAKGIIIKNGKKTINK
ncbi:MAG: leucine-rich repeat protein, partial [Prevotella sp.]|nr:leucine-rich repeat protein [Prevotella sp.]